MKSTIKTRDDPENREGSQRSDRLTDSYEMALMALAVAEEHKGEDALILDMRRVTLVADYFVLVTGRVPEA